MSILESRLNAAQIALDEATEKIEAATDQVGYAMRHFQATYLVEAVSVFLCVCRNSDGSYDHFDALAFFSRAAALAYAKDNCYHNPSDADDGCCDNMCWRVYYVRKG